MYVKQTILYVVIIMAFSIWFTYKMIKDKNKR